MTTVLIAAAEYLGPMKARGEFTDALAFADTDALRALECITRQRPQVVALERLFAATSRGNALINRVKADPALSGCHIRIVSHQDRPAGGASPSPAAPAAAPPVPEPVLVVADLADDPPALPLDEVGTRSAPRYEIVEGVEVLVDGNPATLIDMSLTGVQIVSQTSVKPNQHVRLTLPNGTRPLRLSGSITWAQFEMPQSGPRYRAGIRFHDGDQEGLDAFLQKHRKEE